MDAYRGVDRRNRERYLLRIPAQLRVRTPDTEQVLPLFTRDISSRGAFFLVQEMLDPGTRVDVSLYVPIGRARQSEMETSGRVIRREENGVAVHFDSGYRLVSGSS